MHEPWIDAHHHLWQYNNADYPWMSEKMEALRRNFSVSDLEGVAAICDVKGTVVVQARQTLAETEYLLDLAEQSSLIRAVVGWLPPADSSVERWLNRLGGRQALKGV